MDLQIATKEQILKDCHEIDAFLNVTCSEQIEEVSERGNDLNAYLARTVKMLADAKYHLNEMMKDETMEVIANTLLDAKLSAKVQNSLIDSICKYERLLVDKIEQLNKTAKYQIEWCRSRLSMAKEELNNTRGWNK